MRARRLLISLIAPLCAVLLITCGGGGSRDRKAPAPTLTPAAPVTPPPAPAPPPDKLKPVDFRALPNCLDLFTAVAAAGWEGKTEAAYLAECQRLARKPCRVELRLADVSGSHDLADVELLTDAGESAVPALEAAGNLCGYHKHVKAPFTLAHVKKKGLDVAARKVGDRVTLTRTGDVVEAAPWDAAEPRKEMPTGDERYAMLRSFGRPNKFYPHQHQFAFKVKDWAIVAQRP